jgi:Ca-activated chloride channel homolog
VTLVWPSMLWFLGLLPGLAALHLALLRRQRPQAARHAAFANLPASALLGWRQHVPSALLLLALGVLIVATARPATVVTVTGPRSTIILAMDVSQSMAAEDVKPNRLAASQQAARQFIAQQPANVEVGIVAFAGIAFVAQPPTVDHALLFAAIERLKLLRSTAVGSGIIVSLKTIFPDQDLSKLYGPPPTKAAQLKSAALWIAGAAATPTDNTLPTKGGGPGSYESAIIILMTDGRTTVGPDPRRAGQLAADLGVRVFTVAFGSDKGAVVAMAGGPIRADRDEPALRDIAQETGADYFEATSATELVHVYSTMSTRFVGEKKQMEFAFLFAGIGALIAMVAAFLSLWWFGRVA